ncbi:MAG: DNA alkylation repair protein [Rhodothermales bacterium]|nr:DNA alkylation repair protein [Rhodothermales bacterium]
MKQSPDSLIAALQEVAGVTTAKADGPDDDFQKLGVNPGRVFKVAKQFTDLTASDLEYLLESPIYEVRLAAVSVMDFQARAKRTSDAQRESIYELYIRRHDRINSWDLVDRAAPYVVGGYLADRPRDVLDGLARSASPWERRTAIVATYYFIRMDEVEDTFRIAEALVHDDHRFVQTAVGSWVREAGKRDLDRLLRFLDDFAGSMPRTMLRYATEKLDPETRARYR